MAENEQSSDLNDGEREQLGQGRTVKSQTGTGFADPSGELPRPKHHFRSSLNAGTTGDKKHKISPAGGSPSIDLASLEMNFGDDVPSNYGDVQVEETKSGHVVMYDDTPGAERILIKHRRGSGVEMRSDGSVLLRTEYNMVHSIGGSHAMIIEGDFLISAKNLALDVAGDFDLNVGGDYNVRVAGDEVRYNEGSRRDTVSGNSGTVVKANASTTILGNQTNTTLGDRDDIVKGDLHVSVGAQFFLGVTGFSKVSSETEFSMSAPNINIVGADVSVLGDTGTIGGQNIIMYSYNSYIGHTLWATDTVNTGTVHATRANAISFHGTTFHGDLTGNAVTATTAAIGAAGSTTTVSGTNTANDTTATLIPTASLISIYLNKHIRGIQKIAIDVGNYLYNKIDLTKRTGGVTKNVLTTRQARSKLKDKNNAANNEFIVDLIGRNIISPNIGKSVPPAIGRSSSADGSLAILPENPLRSGSGQGYTKLVSGSRSKKTVFPDLKYNPNMIVDNGPKSINGKTLLGKSIPMSTFLSTLGGTTNLGHITTFSERQALARQLLLQTEVLNIARNAKDKFREYRCVVTEGVYVPEPLEVLYPGGVKDLARDGLAITYELFDANNKSYPDITFEFAEYLAEFMSSFDKIILNYDQLNPDNDDINSQIIVVMPKVDSDYEAPGNRPSFFNVETRYNNRVLSDTDLTEVVKLV